MSRFYSGQDGKLIVNDVTIAKVRSWSFTANQAVLETSSLADTDRTLIPGMRSVTGSCSIYYYRVQNDATDQTTDVGDLLANVLTANTGSGGEQGGDTKSTVKFQLQIADGGASTGVNTSIDFHAYITSLSMTSSVGEVMSADVSFEVNGAVTGLIT
tara:strand:+ start:37 stop:507 length:471 start_codon:yes stop_codon:yes gene_type:complete